MRVNSPFVMVRSLKECWADIASPTLQTFGLLLLISEMFLKMYVCASGSLIQARSIRPRLAGFFCNFGVGDLNLC
jgi:hypothetical protein